MAKHQPAFAATYLLAEGFFAAKMRRDAVSALESIKVAAPLVHAHDAASAAVVAECFVERVDAALAELNAA